MAKLFSIKVYFYSVRTELVGQGAISRLAITQADVRHSGVYTCAVSDNISQSLRLHIIDGIHRLSNCLSKLHLYIKLMRYPFQNPSRCPS